MTQDSDAVKQIRKYVSEYTRAPLTSHRKAELDQMSDEDLKTIAIGGGKSAKEVKYAVQTLVRRGAYDKK